MDQGGSKSPSKPLLQLFQEAWDELCAERGADNPPETTEIVTRGGEKKNVNGYEFWQQMIKEVEDQKDDPDYLFYSPTNEEKIENLFTTSVEPQPEEESAFYMNGKYYIPRVSNIYLQNLNLGYDQWFIVQDFPPTPRIIKILRRKRFVSPSSSDDEIMLELIYAMEMSDNMEKERLAKQKKETEERTEKMKDSKNTEVNTKSETLKPNTADWDKPGTSKIMDTTKKQKDQLDVIEMENVQRIMLGEIRRVKRMEKERRDAEELQKQLQALEKGHVHMDEVMEIENTQEPPKVSYNKELESKSSFDLTACLEDVYTRDEPTPFRDTTRRELRSNVGSQNITSQNINMSANFPNVVHSPRIPVLIRWPRPNYGRAPYFVQQGGFRKPVYPYKFCNPYGGRGLRRLIRNPFAFRGSRSLMYPVPFTPPPAHLQPRSFLQHLPGAPTLPSGHVSQRPSLPARTLPQDILNTHSLTPSSPAARSSSRSLLQTFTLTPPPPPAHMSSRSLYHQAPSSSPQMSGNNQTNFNPTPPVAPETKPSTLRENSIWNQQNLPMHEPPVVIETFTLYPPNFPEQFTYEGQDMTPINYPSVHPKSQWTPQSQPVIIHNLNNISAYEPENFLKAHEASRTPQLPPEIPPHAKDFQFINSVPAHLSNISTTLGKTDKQKMVLETTYPGEYLIVVKKKSAQSRMIAQAPLSSIIPLPEDDVESEIIMQKEYPPITAKPKKSSIRLHGKKRNQKRKKVHFPRSVVEKDELKNSNKQSNNEESNDTNLMSLDDVDKMQKEMLDELMKIQLMGKELKERREEKIQNFNEYKTNNQKSNADKSDVKSKKGGAADEREYLQTPSIFDILESRKHADPNEPEKSPTNYMEDVIQRKERRWRSMDEVSGSPSLDLVLDMIRKDNEMLEEEERLQREQKARTTSAASSSSRQTDTVKVAETPGKYLEVPKTSDGLQSPKEVSVLNPPDVILNTNQMRVTVLVHAVQSPPNQKSSTITYPPVARPEKHAHQDVSKIEEIKLDDLDEIMQLPDVTPSKDSLNQDTFENVPLKSEESVILPISDEIPQTIETIRVRSPEEINAIRDSSSTSTNIRTVGNRNIEIDEDERALLNNLSTSNERFSVGVFVPDAVVLKLKDRLNEKWWKTYKPNIEYKKKNFDAATTLRQTKIKKRYSMSPETKPSNSNDSQDQPIKKMMRCSIGSCPAVRTDDIAKNEDQESQTIVHGDSGDKLDRSTDVQDESSQTDERKSKDISYAAIVRKPK